MTEMEKRWKRGIERVIKEDDEGTGKLEKKWRHAVEEKEKRPIFDLEEREIIHIIKKLFHVPLHVGVKEELKIACEIARKLWKTDFIGDPETMFKGVDDDK